MWIEVCSEIEVETRPSFSCTHAGKENKDYDTSLRQLVQLNKHYTINEMVLFLQFCVSFCEKRIEFDRFNWESCKIEVIITLPRIRRLIEFL
jgi:hypothetical protein